MRCWSCHKVEMKEVEDKAGCPFRKCPECGATDTDIPELGAATMTKGHSKMIGATGWTPRPVSKKRRAKE